MNLMHLRYFCKLAETQHYTRAAAELFISQPGLSGAIDSLESELGIVLFQKKGRNVTLTKQGQEFYNYVRESLHILDQGIDAASVHTGNLGGTVRVATITTIDDSFLPMIVSSFRKLYPQVELRFYQAQTKQAIQWIKDEVCDVGFGTYLGKSDSSELTAVPVLSQQVTAVVTRDHPLAGRDSVALTDLVPYSILTYTDEQPIGRKFRKLLEEQIPDIPPYNLKFVMHNEIFMAGYLLQSRLNTPERTPVGLCVSTPYLEEHRDLKLLPVERIPENFHQVCMLYKPNGFQPYAATLFAKYVEENFALDAEEAK